LNFLAQTLERLIWRAFLEVSQSRSHRIEGEDDHISFDCCFGVLLRQGHLDMLFAPVQDLEHDNELIRVDELLGWWLEKGVDASVNHALWNLSGGGDWQLAGAENDECREKC
jgi:hypothetical protein